MTAARTDGAAGLALVTAAGLGQILLCAWFGLLAWLSLGVTVWAAAHAYRRFGEGARARGAAGPLGARQGLAELTLARSAGVIEVTEILDRWPDAAHLYVKLRGSDGAT